MRVGFLLGAGVSIPAGMPCTGKLTEFVLLHVDNYTLHTDGSFGKSVDGINGALDWPKKRGDLKSLLDALRNLCQTYFDEQKDNGRKANYEDIFFAAVQLYEHLVNEYENPALEPLVQGLQRRDLERAGLKDIASLACDYIQDVVAIELGSGVPAKRNHLTCLVDAISDKSFSGCDIFTLNHDVLIESVLESQAIGFVDGFGPRDGDTAPWSPSELENDSRTLLLKLHGSINWRRYNGALKKTLTADPNHAVTANGTMAPIPARELPVLLGTFNKIRDYFNQPYFDLVAAFRRQMAAIETLVVSGYSFRDKGVNTILVEWMRGSSNRNMLILDEKGEGCVAGARGAIRNLWGEFGNTRMRVHRKYLSDCGWQNLVARHFVRGSTE